MTTSDQDESRPWPRLPYLDVLRPGDGMRCDLAVLATYSVDLSALGAALMSLAGAGDEDTGGSKADFVNAVETLRGRFGVLVQRGRIAFPPKSHRSGLAVLLDKFIIQQPYMESTCSWHPKLMLLKFSQQRPSKHGYAEWRVWIGSRNLACGPALDAGLLLIGGPHGRKVPGLTEAGIELLRRAEPLLSPSLRRQLVPELSKLLWTAPSGIRVEHLVLFGEGVAAEPLKLPNVSPRTSRITVVSPFVDKGGLDVIRRWGPRNAERRLVSTAEALAKFSATDFDQVRVSAVRGGPPEDNEERPTNADDTDVPLGLHAKLYVAEHGSTATIVLGSPNATGRAWSNNAEAAVVLTARTDAIKGLLDWIANNAVHFEPFETPVPEDKAEKYMDDARSRITERWDGATVIRVNERYLLRCAPPPHAQEKRCVLFVGLLGRTMREWKRDEDSVDLGPVIAADETYFVQLRLEADGKTREWVLLTPMDGGLDPGRDAAAVSRALDAKSVLAWIGGDLEITVPAPSAEDDWREPRRKTGSPTREDERLPTLQDVMRCGAADPAVMQRVLDRTRKYLKRAAEQEPEPEQRRRYLEFVHSIETIARGLASTSDHA